MTSANYEPTRIIDFRNAKSIARRFFEKNHSLIIFKNVILEGDTWNVILDIGFESENIVHVKIDAETGKVRSYS